MTYIVKREKFQTELGRKLYDTLVKISDDDDFILAVLVEMQGDEKKHKFLELLEKTGMNTEEEVLEYLDGLED